MNDATTIKKNAALLLEEKEILSSLEHIGQVYFSGSYALDLMTWNDIDMQIALKETCNPMQALSSFFQKMCLDEDFVEGKIKLFEGEYKTYFPRGIYLQFKFESIRYGGTWKLDLWAMRASEIEQNQALVNRIKAALTPDLRKLIIAMKRELMKKTGRVPQRGSHFIYEAVLFENKRSQDDIIDYLKKRGVEI